jgi:hypothetical protein
VLLVRTTASSSLVNVSTVTTGPKTLVWDEAHLLHTLREHETHYTPTDLTTHHDIQRPDRLGGIVHEYHHAA